MAAAGRRQADPAGQQVGALPRADHQRAADGTASAGILAFTLPEALWLADCGASDDIVVAYPTADRTAPGRLAGDAAAAAAITVMVDCPEHLDMIEKAAASTGSASTVGQHGRPHPVRVCIDIDAGYMALGGLLRAGGAPRSPVRTPPTPPRWPPRSPPGRGCGWPG